MRLILLHTARVTSFVPSLNPTEPSFRVVWPSSPKGVQARSLAARLSGTLAGKRIGFLWDYLFRGEELFPVLQRELSNRYPGVEFVGYGDFGNLHGPEEAQLVGQIPSVIAARGVDAVVSGVGC
jgi:hypothetical protein